VSGAAHCDRYNNNNNNNDDTNNYNNALSGGD